MINLAARQFVVGFAVGILMLPGCNRKESVSLLNATLDGKNSYWVSGLPEENGFDGDQLRGVVEEAEKLSNFYALIVIRNRKAIVERYFKGATPDELYHIRSITKNFTSALTGIAIEEKKLKGPDVNVKDYFPELLTGEKESITVRHLLNISSGLEWDEATEILSFVENRVANPIANVLSRPVMQTPGEKWNYNSITTHVLGRVVEKVTATSLDKLAETKIFKPLGIEEYAWEKDPEGFAWGGYGLELKPEDLAKFGQLYLQKGKWEGAQVVPESWVAQSAAMQIENGAEGGGYSNQWWYADMEADDEPIYYGLGYGGQGLVIIPHKNMVIVALQKHNVPSKRARDQSDSLVEKIARPIYEAIK
ncbi:MAG: serine hydrolase domain-containing protein [Mariniblastus sp.]